MRNFASSCYLVTVIVLLGKIRPAKSFCVYRNHILSSYVNCESIGSLGRRTITALMEEPLSNRDDSPQNSSRPPSERDNVSDRAEFNLEEVSRRGADKIAKMSLEERTQRAMIAEAVEDRMVALHDQLDVLLGSDGMPRTVGDRKEVEALAREIKVLRNDYRELVSGETSRWISGFGDLKSGSKEN